MKKQKITKKTDILTRAQVFITFLIRASLIIVAVKAITVSNWETLFVISLAFVLSFLPYIIEKSTKIDLPVELEIATVLFVYASIFLGEVNNFYYRFWWWDLLLHTASAVSLGFIGFMILFILYKSNKIKAMPLTIVVFSFCFSMAFAAIWEIFEFSMDQLFGFNMQKSGLLDTMGDLIVAALGALIASLIGFVYLKDGETFIFNKIMKRFVRDNPKFVNE